MPEIELVEKYKQQYAHFGRMNDILYKLPVLFSTLIGALWYFSFSFMEKDRFLSLMVLLFAACLAVVFILVMHRFRLAFNAYIDNINEMDGDHKISLKHSKAPSTIALIQYSLLIACILSVISGGYLIYCRA